LIGDRIDQGKKAKKGGRALDVVDKEVARPKKAKLPKRVVIEDEDLEDDYGKYEPDDEASSEDTTGSEDIT
jgi:hypothetical protein